MTLTARQLLTADARRDRLVAICKALPETVVEPAGETHLSIRIRKKIFGYYSFDHHGDGKIALYCKSSLSEQRRLIREDAESFFVPAYLGSRGWISVRLDLEEVDWEVVGELLRRAYQEIAPRKLAALLDEE
jgi:predicted DNA-binding protein (MmcQ/YjbR family)